MTETSRRFFLGFGIILLLPHGVFAAPDNSFGASCREFRAKKKDVPVYREADRRSEVIAHLDRSQVVCGLAEAKEFVTVLWDRPIPELVGPAEPAKEPPPSTDEVPHAYVRTVDLWPPRRESPEQKNDAREWWELHKQGVVPDDPYFWLRPFLSFFGFSKKDIPGQQGGNSTPPGNQAPAQPQRPDKRGLGTSI